MVRCPTKKPTQKFVIMLALLALLISAWSSPSISRGDDPKLKPLFDGKSFANFKEPAKNRWWSIEDQMIRCQSGPQKKGSTLWTKRDYQDVVIQFDFKMGAGTVDSGLFVRNNDQIQIGISGSLKRDMTGSPYIPGKGYPQEAEGVATLLKAKDWNTMKVRAVGNRYTIWLNGKQVNDYRSETSIPKGPLGFQLHPGRTMEIWFRNISLAEIDSPAKPATQPADSKIPPAEGSLPNIVMIISDDQAWNDYSFMGHAHVKTPNLDQLAKRSVLFRRGYVPTALCRPSLMTMITGRYAHQHGITGNDPSPKYAARGSAQAQQRRAQLISKIDQQVPLPKQLAKVGYTSFQSGKWWEGNFRRGGFTDGMTRGFPQPGGRHGDDGLKIGREGLKPVTTFMETAVKNKQPFLVWYAPFLPHAPHRPPKRLFDKYAAQGLPKTVARYYAMCEWFDETCGELIESVDRLGVTDNTIVVYVCDNGWIQDPNRDGYAPRSKQTAYEGGIRTPIMFSWPAKWKPADRVELCSSIDLVPTLLAATGQPVPRDLPGENLLSALEQGTPIARDTLLGEGFAHDIADLELPEASLIYRWCIRGKWKLILTYDGEINRYQSSHPRDIKGPQLFDLETDPFEARNVADQHPKKVAELSAAIQQWYPLRKRKLIE